MNLNQIGNGRRAVSSKRIPAFLRNWRILYCVILLLLILLLIARVSGNKSQKKYEEALATIENLNSSITQLEGDKSALEAEVQRQSGLVLAAQQENTKLARAMDLYWQIDEAFVLGRNDRCRGLIQILESEALAPVLPTVSTTDNGRFSPYDRYAEICEALKEPYGNGVKQ